MQIWKKKFIILKNENLRKICYFFAPMHSWIDVCAGGGGGLLLI